MRCIDVIIPREVPCTYSYLAEEGLCIDIGTSVQVPFGKQILDGIVTAIRQNVIDTDRLKHIIGVYDTKLTLPLAHIALIQWLQKTYLISPSKALATLHPYLDPVDEPKTNPDKPLDTPLSLSEEQTHCFNAIIHSPSVKKFLVHGITGSGKTELYMHLAKSMLDQKKQALILIPEIALTPQFFGQFHNRFGKDVVVLHSKLTPKKRAQAWQSIYHGRTPIVVGTRSALFAPFQNLGLIIMDECHDASYKQDQDPRYDSEEVVDCLSQWHNASVVLGSATPQLSMYKKSVKNHTLLTLSKRINKQPLPPIHIINLSDPLHPPDGLLTHPLRQAMQDTLQNNKKVLLLLNRRGYAPYIVCQKCLRVHACPHCQLSYTYHRDRSVRCHRCFISKPFTHTCLHCHQPKLQLEGMGTQKLEIEVTKWFQNYLILRLDKDSGSTPKKTEAILDAFKTKGDILIGTQLIAKGHHIEDITLVGILGIDSLLNMPDYTASERTFQLITQVAGRAGRGVSQGQVWIQTHQPDHYAITHAKNHDTQGFWAQETAFRESLGYPPFCELIHVIFSGLDKQKMIQTAQEFSQGLRLGLDPIWDILQVLGPCPAPIEQIRHHHRWHLLIKTPAEHIPFIKKILSTYKKPMHTRVLYDFSPRNII